ncbi:hypothetical protein NEOLI_004175, partial [Neolecta irregularis DAH-3]
MAVSRFKTVTKNIPSRRQGMQQDLADGEEDAKYNVEEGPSIRQGLEDEIDLERSVDGENGCGDDVERGE